MGRCFQKTTIFNYYTIVTSLLETYGSETKYLIQFDWRRGNCFN